MQTQRFYGGDGRCVTYGVTDIDYDYANVVFVHDGDQAGDGMGYVLRDALPDASGERRWFAYRTGGADDMTGSQVASEHGYATMEGAIRGLLQSVVGASSSQSGRSWDGGMDGTYGYYEQAPVSLDISRDVVGTQLVPKKQGEILYAGGIHQMTSQVMLGMASEFVAAIQPYRRALEQDGCRISADVRVDVPCDPICGEVIVDASKPFDGMTLHCDLIPSACSVMPTASMELSVVDLENSTGEDLVVGTFVVSDGDSVLGGAAGLPETRAGSFVSTAADAEASRRCVRDTVKGAMSEVLLSAVAEYQSMFASVGEWGSDDNADVGMREEYL